VNRIIEDLLDLSRIEGQGSPTREPIAVSLIVAEGIERIRTSAEQHDVKSTSKSRRRIRWSSAIAAS